MVTLVVIPKGVTVWVARVASLLLLQSVHIFVCC